MKYRRIQYFIIYFLLILCLFLSKNELDPANSLWIFLFNNYNELNIINFISINLFYVILIYLYIPTKKSMFTILHFIFNKLYYFKIILFLLDSYYRIYLNYFKLKKNFILKAHLSIISDSDNVDNYYFKRCLYLSIFDNDIFLPDQFRNNLFLLGRFKNNKEKQFYLNLYTDFYTLPIYIKVNNHMYRLTLLDFIGLINLHTQYTFTNFNPIVFQFLSNSKILNKFVKLISFWLQIDDLYFELRSADFSLGIRYYLKYLCNALFRRYYVKSTIKLLKLFKKDRRLIRQFIILLLYRNIKLLKKLAKKKKVILDIDKLCKKNPSISILNINKIQFEVRKPQSYSNYFKKIQFNLFYLYFKNIHTLKTLYKSIVISNFFKEFKIMYKIIKFFLVFYILSFFILKNFFSILIPIYFLSNFFFKLFYTYTIIENRNYWQNKRIVNHTLFRIIYYYLIYSFNFYLLPIDNFYFIILNYLISTIIFIIIISLYDIHSNFFHNNNTPNILTHFEGMTLTQIIRLKLIEIVSSWIKTHQLNYFVALYIKYLTFLDNEKKLYSKELKKRNEKK